MKNVYLTLILVCWLLSTAGFAQRLDTPRPAAEQPLEIVATKAAVPLNQSPFWSTGEEDVYSTGMIWRDMNNDGWIDVCFSNGNDIVRASNFVYLSQLGVMPSTATWLSLNEEYSGHCAVGDLNDDGFPELAVSNFLGPAGFSQPNLLNMYLNNGGTLHRSPDWFSGDSVYTFSCALGDVDGDGDLDLAVATGESYNDVSITDRIYYNVNGNVQTAPGWQSSQATQAMDVTWGDVDNDGDLDLAFCYDDRPEAVYYNNAGTLETSPSWQASINQSANTIIFGDVDGDGWLDLIVAYNNQLGGDGTFAVYFNNGAGVLTTSAGWTSSTGGYGSALSLYDYDNDGDRDLAAGRWFDQPRVYENLGTTFTTSPVWRATPSTVAEEMAWVDIDGAGVEWRADTFSTAGTRSLFYTSRDPLYAIDSVVADGAPLDFGDYCYDLVSGWVSLAAAPVSELIIHYRYSFTNDLTVANWDGPNDAYGSTLEPFVKIAADTTFGFAPFAVQFADSSVAAVDQKWRFGDGDSSFEQHPLHVYQGPGTFDVYLENVSASGWHNHTEQDLVVVLADTITIGVDTIAPGAQAVVPVYLTNSQPLEEIVLPIRTTDSPINLTLVSVERGERTAYFETLSYLTYQVVAGEYRMTLLLRANDGGGTLPLDPGSGEILRLTFNTSGGDVGAFNVIDTFYQGTYEMALQSAYMVYTPKETSGGIRIEGSCCEGATGNVDADSEGTVDLSDLIYLVNYLFLGGPAPSCMAAANVDGDIACTVDLSDLIYFVNYLFLGGPLPAACNPDCL
ncbi:VCBS repeat-containing protein [bacterium]|nr:VCBS repeat-containing protein [bacterium]